MSENSVHVLNGAGNKRNIAERLNDFFNSTNFNKITAFALLILAILQFLAICYFNLFQIYDHLGFDASAIMLKARMIWEQGIIFPANYAEQTNLFFDSAMLPASLLYGITGNIGLSFAISNIILTFIMIFLIYNIGSQLQFSFFSKIVSINFFLTPFISIGYNVANPIDYYPALFFSSSFYSGMVILALLTFKVMLIFHDKRTGIKAKMISILTLALFFLIGLSRGIAVMVYLLVPCILCIIVEFCIHKDFKYIFHKKTLWTVLAAILVIISKIYSVKVLNFESKESSMTLIGIRNFWNNFVNIFGGLGKLMSAGSIDSGVPAMSVNGIYQLCNFLLLIFVLFSITAVTIHFLRKNKYNENFGIIYITSFCFVNFFMYALLSTTYGTEIFEERYLILFYVFSIFFVALFFNYYNDKSFFKKIISVGLLLVIAFVNIIGYYNLNKGKDSFSKDLTDVISKYDAKIVYGYSTLGSDIHIYTRNMRILDNTRVYKLLDNGNIYHWGDYMFYDDVNQISDNSLLLVNQDAFAQLPYYIKSQYEYQESAGRGIDIYKSSVNVFDFVSGLPAEGETSVDFPYSPGVYTANCDETYTTDGTEGYCLWGPNAPTTVGKYRFTFDYSVVQNEIRGGGILGVFDVAINNGSEILGSANIDSAYNKVSVDVSFNGDEAFEYRVWSYLNSNIEINYIEIEKLE